MKEPDPPSEYPQYRYPTRQLGVRVLKRGGSSPFLLLLTEREQPQGCETGMGRQFFNVTNERDSLRGISHAWLGKITQRQSSPRLYLWLPGAYSIINYTYHIRATRKTQTYCGNNPSLCNDLQHTGVLIIYKAFNVQKTTLIWSESMFNVKYYPDSPEFLAPFLSNAATRLSCSTYPSTSFLITSPP